MPSARAWSLTPDRHAKALAYYAMFFAAPALVRRWPSIGMTTMYGHGHGEQRGTLAATGAPADSLSIQDCEVVPSTGEAGP